MTWPTSVATDADLFLAKNRLQSVLASTIGAGDTSLTVTDGTNFPSTGGYFSIGTEAIKYTGKSVNTLTGLTRGADGTVAVGHNIGDAVKMLYVAAHHNVLKDEIIAIEQSLNLTASRALASDASGRLSATAVTAVELGRLAGVSSSVQTQLDGKMRVVDVSAYGAVGDNTTDDYAAIAAALSAAVSAKLPLYFPGKVYFIGTKLTISSDVSIICAQGAVLDGHSTTSVGVELGRIDFTGKLQLPVLQNFTTGLRILGSAFANVECPIIQVCVTALLVDTVHASAASTLDNTIRVEAISTCTNGIRFYADNAANVIQGNEIYANFITNTKYSIFFDGSGATPSWDSNKVVTQAIDPVGISGAIGFYNSSATGINREILRCECWFGNFAADAYYTSGPFDGCDIYIALADTYVGSKHAMTGSQNRVFINGNTGIGHHKPTGVLHVRPAANQTLLVHGSTSLANAVALSAVNDGNTSNIPMELRATEFGFYGPANVAAIDSVGRVNTPGIVFPATDVPSSNANTLDDYEEGTWTPSVGGTATYTTQDGSYTKIGRLVTIRCHLAINSIGSGSTVDIVGLPFTAGSYGTIQVGYFSGLTASVVFLAGTISGTTVSLRSLTAAGASMDADGKLGSGSAVFFSGQYYV